jgi:hypothetical protein
MSETVVPTQVVTDPKITTPAVVEPIKSTPAVEDPKATTLTLEQALEELSKARKEAAKYRTEKKNTEDKDLTEMQKLTKSVEQIQKELTNTKKENMQLKIAKKYNLPDALANRLAGETEEEMDADGQALAGVIGKQTPTSPTAPVVSPTSPTGVTTLTEDSIRKMSPEEINKNWDAVSAALSKK